jgi:hypothetical protein
VSEEALAQVGQDALADPAGQVRLRRVREQVEEAGRRERDDDPAEQGQVVAADPVVDRDLCQLRGRERRADRT